MLHGAIYDVVNAIDGTPGFFLTSTAPTGTSVDAAVASSAHTMLAYLFPAQKATFDAALAADLALVPNGPGETQGVTLGQTIAQTIIALRAADGLVTPAAPEPRRVLSDGASFLASHAQDRGTRDRRDGARQKFSRRAQAWLDRKQPHARLQE